MDENNNSNNGVEKYTSFASTLNKKTANAGSSIGKAASKAKKIFTNPAFIKFAIGFLIAIFALIFVFVLIASIVSAFIPDTYDKDAGTLGPLYGIQNDKFYGVRVIYEDNVQTLLEIKETYLKFTYDILQDLNNNGLGISDLTEDYQNNANIIKITSNFAKDLALNSNASANTSSLETSLESISHYGFTDDEVSIVFDSIASTIKNENLSTVDLLTIKTNLNSSYADEKYAINKMILPRIIVKDYILSDESPEIPALYKQKYLGYVFMPKQEVTFESLSFMFVVSEPNTVEVELKQSQNGESQTICPKTTVDHTWYKDNDFEIYEMEDKTSPVTQFTAINQSNLQELAEGESIYSLIKNEIYSTYFKAIDGEYTAEKLLANINAENYIYLQTSTDVEFNLAEYITSY